MVHAYCAILALFINLTATVEEEEATATRSVDRIVVIFANVSCASHAITNGSDR